MTWFALDTDLLLYRAVSATEREVDWGGDIFSLTTNLEEAKDALGDKFDIRGFHDTILGGGALPLHILERRVDQWVEKQKQA